jgi:hypothetical protein
MMVTLAKYVGVCGCVWLVWLDVWFWLGWLVWFWAGWGWTGQSGSHTSPVSQMPSPQHGMMRYGLHDFGVPSQMWRLQSASAGQSASDEHESGQGLLSWRSLLLHPLLSMQALDWLPPLQGCHSPQNQEELHASCPRHVGTQRWHSPALQVFSQVALKPSWHVRMELGQVHAASGASSS